jgi:hypothetical protein
LNDAAEKYQEGRRPVCRSTTIQTEFKIHKPKNAFYPYILKASTYSTGTPGSDFLFPSGGQSNQGILHRRKSKVRVPERDS